MKVKIITCHYAYNYGAVLQTYALTKYLNMQGLDTKVINYRPWYYKGSTSKTNKIRLFIRRLIRIPDNYKSEKIFTHFLNEYIPLTCEYKSYSELDNSDIQSDFFIAGSDQIWNMNLPNGRDRAFYFEFVKKGKKISYAASLGMDYLDNEQREYILNHIAKFDEISVRENTAKQLLGSNKKIDVVMDPVYLLSKNDWKKLEKKPNKYPDEKYILVFAFNRQKEIFDFGKKLAKKYGYKVVSINTFWEDFFNGMDRYFWNCTPNEFLYLLSHAECIVTNSFHGLSFSFIYNKSVILFQKNDKGNSRMLDLITRINAEEVINKEWKQKVEIPKIDFKKINSALEIEREKSKEFLKRSLSKEKVE
jgi:hypothetical protein